LLAGVLLEEMRGLIDQQGAVVAKDLLETLALGLPEGEVLQSHTISAGRSAILDRLASTPRR
jgi:hypothetical protein